MLELVKTGGLVAVAVVSAVLGYDLLGQRYFGLERTIAAAYEVLRRRFSCENIELTKPRPCRGNYRC